MTEDNARLTILDVVRIFADYREKPDNGAWGSLHNVLEDGNVADKDVSGCIKLAQEQGDVDGLALARTLLTLSRTQRLKLPGAVDALLQERGSKADVGFSS